MSLEANAKTDQPPYGVGDEMEYTITSRDEKYGAKGKVSKPDSGGNYSGGRGGSNSSRDEIIAKQTALKCAAEYHAQRQSSPDAVIEDAQKFFDWLMGKGQE